MSDKKETHRLAKLIQIVFFTSLIACAFYVGTKQPKTENATKKFTFTKKAAPKPAPLPSDIASLPPIDEANEKDDVKSAAIAVNQVTGTTTIFTQHGEEDFRVRYLRDGIRLSSIGEDSYAKVMGPYFPLMSIGPCAKEIAKLGIPPQSCQFATGPGPSLAAALRRDGRADFIQGNEIIRTVDEYLAVGYLNKPMVFAEPRLSMLSWRNGKETFVEVNNEILSWNCGFKPTPDKDEKPELIATFNYPIGRSFICGKTREFSLIVQLTKTRGRIVIQDENAEEILLVKNLPEEFHLAEDVELPAPPPSAAPSGGVEL